MINWELVEKAVMIRRFEELLLQLFRDGKLNGTVHTCLGQEWTGVAVCKYLQDGDTVFSNHRGHGHFLARTGNVEGLLAEIMGKATGVCGGIGGSQHIYQDGFFSNGILGGMTPVAAGNAYAHKLANRPNIGVVFIGDGALGEGIVYETLNLASKWEIPLLVVVERNGYAQSTNIKQTFAGTIAERAAAFDIQYFEATTWDVSGLLKVSEAAVSRVREEGYPALLEIQTYRLAAHSKGDDNRDAEEIARFQEKDSLSRILAEGGDRIIEIEERVKDSLAAALMGAEKAESCKLLGRAVQNPQSVTWKTPAYHSDRYSNLLYDCLRELFIKNDNLLMIGEDIEDDYGGAFKISRDLSSLFSGRVRNTPISEAAITGVGSGLALGGFLPIVEIMFGDFLTLTFDQLLQHASKFEPMYNGQAKIPMIVRTPMGGRRGYGPTHSQSIEAFFLGIPNLDVFALNIRVAPGAIYQPLMNPSRPPALVIENKVLYTRTLRTEPISGYLIEVTDEAFPTVRIRPKDVRPEVTIVCYGGMLELVEDAIGMLFSEHEIVCEVISPTRLVPLNMNPIVDSVSQTGRVLIAEEGKTFAAWGSEVLAELCRDGCRMQRVARLGNNQLIPSNFEAENQRLAGIDDIIKAVNGMIYD